jgi:hypothetical protein
VARAVQPRIDALLADWREIAPGGTIDWWLDDGAGAPFTSSRQPSAESPASWYGAAYCARAPPPATRELIEILHRLRTPPEPEASGRTFEGACAICLDPLGRGDTNSVTLGCGHIYHWAATEAGCGGLLIWSELNASCPTCRQPFGGSAPGVGGSTPVFEIDLPAEP